MRLLAKPTKPAKKKFSSRGGVVVRSAEGVRFAYTGTQIKAPTPKK